MPINGHIEIPRSDPAYFSSLQELDNWNATRRSRSSGYDGIVGYNQQPRQMQGLEGQGKLLVCHDYKGGYTESSFALSYTFNFWSYCDTFVYFSHHRVTVPPPGWTSAAHRNGTKMLGTLIFEGDGESDCLRLIVGKMPQSKTGPVEQPVTSMSLPISPHYAKVLAHLAKERGFDGYLLNFECPLRGGTEQTRALAAWITLLQDEILSQVGPHGETIWYDSVVFSGQLAWQNRLNSYNLPFFLSSSGLFLNYFWPPDYTAKTAQYFLSLDPALTGNGPNSSLNTDHKTLQDIYVGVDVWGRGSHGGGGFDSYKAITHISPQSLGLSVALFGQAWTWESEQDKPGWNWDTWWDYESKLWVGPVKGTIEVPEAPRRKNEPECVHGPFLAINSFFPRISPPDPYLLPFNTTFSPGVGRSWFVNGTQVFQSKNGWTDVDKQFSVGDLVWPRPTIKWEDDRQDTLPEVTPSFCMDDAWNGGNSLRLSFNVPESSHDLAAYRSIWLPIQSVSVTPNRSYTAEIIYKAADVDSGVDIDIALNVKVLSPAVGYEIIIPPEGAKDTQLAGWTKLSIEFSVTDCPSEQVIAAIGLVCAIVSEDTSKPLEFTYLLGKVGAYPKLPAELESEHDVHILWVDFQQSSTLQSKPMSGILTWEVAASLPFVSDILITTAEDLVSAWRPQPSSSWIRNFLYFNIYCQKYTDQYIVKGPSDAVWLGTSGLYGSMNSFMVIGENLKSTLKLDGDSDKVRFYVQGVTYYGEILPWNRCAYVDVTI